MVSTPAAMDMRMPASLAVCAETGRPPRWAASTIAFNSAWVKVGWVLPSPPTR